MKISSRQLMRFLVLLAFVSVVSLFYWILYKKPIAGIDDSDIYFTYVKNFVNGFGFVYYPGGERVEGFTSLLWVLIVSVFYAIDADNFPRIILVFNVITISFGLFLCCNFIKKLTNSTAFITPAEILFLALLTVIPGYIDWTILTLMETGLWSVLLIAISLQVASYRPESRRDAIAISLMLAVLVTVRPESLLWCYVFIFLMMLKAYLHFSTVKQSLRNVLLPLALVVGSIGALTLFRMQYFGYPLPNTFYAKVSTDTVYNITQGLRYYAFSAIQSPLLVLITLTAAIAWVSSALVVIRSLRNRVALSEVQWIQFALSAIALVALAIPVYIGGDHFQLLRFYQPFFPVFLLLFFNVSFWESLVQVKLNVRPIHRYAMVFLLIPFIYLLTDSPLHTFRKEKSPIAWEFGLSALGRSDASKMNAMFSRLDSMPSVGVSAAGGFGYAYNGSTIDLMGLNNLRMAHATKVKVGLKNHAAFDKNTFYELKPNVFHGYFKISSFVESTDNRMLFQNTPGFENSFVNNLYKKIFDDKEFIASYQPVMIHDPQTNLILKTYVEKNFIGKLRKNNYKVIENYWETDQASDKMIIANAKKESAADQQSKK